MSKEISPVKVQGENNAHPFFDIGKCALRIYTSWAECQSGKLIGSA
jgi:hypothetical protein